MIVPSRRSLLAVAVSLFVLAAARLAGEAGAGSGKSAQEPQLRISAPDGYPNLSLGGYAQVLYSARESVPDEFDVRRARLILSGAVAEDIMYELSFEGTGDEILRDAYLDLVMLDSARLRLGQFKTPFSREFLTSSSKLHTIERALVVDEFAPGRDVGMRLSGEFTLLDYDFAVVNGAGINTSDDNDHKDLVGRILFHPLPDMEMGVSHYEGEATPDEITRRRSGAQFSWEVPPFLVQSEFIIGTEGELDKDGWYGLAAYQIRPELEAVVKFEQFDPDDDIENDRVETATVGLTWFLHEYAKLMANYLFTDNDANAIEGNSALLQFQVRF